MTIDEAEKRVEYFISQNQDLLTCSEEVKAYYRERMQQQKGFRRFKNKAQTKSGIWRTRRRSIADEGV